MSKRIKKALITESIEFVSSELFINYSDTITELIGRSAGIYALYKENKLYYVGRAVHLKRRIKQHLNDKHQNKWTHFSLYLINEQDHIGEFESLLVRIAKPGGNSVRPRGKDNRSLKKLKLLIKDRHKEELRLLLPNANKVKKVKRNRKGTRPESLKGLVTKRTTLTKTYLGKEYNAKLTPGGIILFKNRKYESPTAAAKAIVKNRPVNGWHFWSMKNAKGKLVKLKNF
jgi:Restriction Enzyme Adenine Methylase Associated/GIY-YIG catalytic domain